MTAAEYFARVRRIENAEYLDRDPKGYYDAMDLIAEVEDRIAEGVAA